MCDIDFQPKVSPAAGAVVTGREAVLTMTHVGGYSPSVARSLLVGHRVSEPAAVPTMAWAAARRATGTRNGEQDT